MSKAHMKKFGTSLREKHGDIKLRDCNENSIKIALVGDFDFHAETLIAMREHGAEYLFEGVQKELSDADLRIGNLETALVDSAYTILGPKAYLISELGAIEGISSAGFEVITLANNHTMDAGKDALIKSISTLESNGILVSGAGTNESEARKGTVFDKDGLSVGVLAYSYKTGNHVATENEAGCAEALLDNILKDLERVKESAKICIVSLHMDAEFQELPSPDRVKMCRAIADAGAEVVICHHPHVIQGIELHNGSVIAYSLGNYVTPVSKYMTDHTNECHLSIQLEVDLSISGLSRIKVVPLVLDEEGRPHIALGSEKERIFAMLEERSNLLFNQKELNLRYRKMIGEYVCSLSLSLLRFLKYRNWGAISLYWAEIKSTPTKQRWIKDYLLMKYKK